MVLNPDEFDLEAYGFGRVAYVRTISFSEAIILFPESISILDPEKSVSAVFGANGLVIAVSNYRHDALWVALKAGRQIINYH